MFQLHKRALVGKCAGNLQPGLRVYIMSEMTDVQTTGLPLCMLLLCMLKGPLTSLVNKFVSKAAMVNGRTYAGCAICHIGSVSH